MIVAHGLGERYDLPAPLAYFIAVAALTVGLSFVVTVAVARGAARGDATGGNLLGTVNATPAIGVVNARVTWYVAIGAIVAGHVMSVWLGHRMTVRAFGRRRRAVIASVPLTVLMVAYTALSLSVIAEPLVRFRTPDPSYSLDVDAGRTSGARL